MSANITFACGHSARYSKPLPNAGEIAYCYQCKGYQTVSTSGKKVYIVICKRGNATAQNSEDVCYRDNQFKTLKVAQRWAKSHKHPTEIYDRSKSECLSKS